jgi:hypothetical protein
MNSRHFLLTLALFMSTFSATSVYAEGGNKELAATILNDKSLDVIDSMALHLLTKGFNAGGGYSEVWIRDFNTFAELACKAVPTKNVKEALLVFFKLQQPNGEIVDGYVLSDFPYEDKHPYFSDLDKTHVGFKNTVETDQETSLIQTISKYIKMTGDRSILSVQIGGKTVYERMKIAVDYLLKERYNKRYGLIFGATTSDWGDVQPLDDQVVDIDDKTDFAIDVYDNAMFLIALDDLCGMSANAQDVKQYKALHAQVAKNVRKYLWDEKHQKFIPHIYLDKNPVPKGFDESKVFYHGGTAIAIEAGLLNKQEIANSNRQMLENCAKSGMATIGLTIYPTYPIGYFHGGMAQPYIYQNGGDWTWFGGRMIQQLAKHGFVQEAYQEMRPMIDRVLKNKGFYEWYGPGNKPNGSDNFKGSAGVLYKAIQILKDWARAQK